jgi:GT2 family glycosyltransferase
MTMPEHSPAAGPVAARRRPISVVICTCDRPDDIGRAVESVLGQDYPVFEVLVVDQSRSASTQVVARQLPPTPHRLQYIRLKERGLSRAYNRGIAQASYELIAFTDDDCVAPPGWLDAVARAFSEQEDVSLLYGQVLEPLEPEDSSQGGVVPTLPIGKLQRLSRRDGFRVFGMGANFAARRSMIQRLGGFDEALGGGGPLLSAQDFDLTYRVYHADGVILLDPRVVVHHYGFRSDTEWPATIRSYGVGVGAFYLKHVRAGDPFATMLLVRLLAAGAVRLARRWLLRQPTRQYRTYLGYLAVGMWRSRSYAVDRRRRLYRLPVGRAG